MSEKETQLEVLDLQVRKVEDICNSAKALAEKVGSVEVDLFECPDDELSETLSEVSRLASTVHVDLTAQLDRLKMKYNAAMSGNEI